MGREGEEKGGEGGKGHDQYTIDTCRETLQVILVCMTDERLRATRVRLLKHWYQHSFFFFGHFFNSSKNWKLTNYPQTRGGRTNYGVFILILFLNN